MKKTLNKKIMFTGGGSGGHISAATAIIDELKQKYLNCQKMIVYVGGEKGMEGEKDQKSMEQRIIGSTDIRFISIRSGKLQRYFSLRTLKNFIGVLGGVRDAFKVISEESPELIISTGGYVTVPVCFAGWIKRIPIYIHEQTATVGLTNKISGKFAKKIFTSFDQSKMYFPQKKVIHVGNPIRKSVFSTEGEGEVVDAMKQMLDEKKERPIILMLGGGQGSHLLNLTVRQMIRYASEDFQIILQTGDNQVHRDYDLLLKEKNKLPEKCRSRFFPVKYISSDQIGVIFNNIDLFVGRSGANTVYEMGVLQIPSIFIPIPWVTHNEQYENAKILQDAGLATIIPEGEVTAERLYTEIKKSLTKVKSNLLNIDENTLKKTFPTDAAKKIVEILPLD